MVQGYWQKIYGPLQRTVWSIMVCCGIALFRLGHGLGKVKRFQHESGWILVFLVDTTLGSSLCRVLWYVWYWVHNRCAFL